MDISGGRIWWLFRLRDMEGECFMQGKGIVEKIQWADPGLIVFQRPAAIGHCSSNGSNAGDGTGPVGTCSGNGTGATQPGPNWGKCNAGGSARDNCQGGTSAWATCHPNGTDAG